jgi:8-amino-7-oxononanoate synthase
MELSSIKATLKMNFEKELTYLKEKHLYRQTEEFDSCKDGYLTKEGKQYLNLVSNNYLGLQNNEEISQRSIEYIKKWGNGSSGSRLLGGSYNYHSDLELKLAQFKSKDNALIFNSGYSANLALASVFCDSKTHLFMDKQNHASLYDGFKLSEAKLHRYNHNDMKHLESLLEKYDGKKIIISESLFSMDGDFALLEELSFLKNKYNTLLFIDEAHAESLYGPSGKGLLFETNTAPSADLILGTFGKGYGTSGAYLAGNEDLIDYLRNKARSFIYSTSLAPATIGAMDGAIDVSIKSDDKREHLQNLSTYLRQHLLVRGWDLLNTKSHIIPLIIGDNQTTIALSNKLREAGFWVHPIREPTVARGTARLRINVCADHTHDQLDEFIEKLTELKLSMGIK